MQFENEKRGHVKIVRACSLVLAMLIMCSMLFVGNVTEFGASALTSFGGLTISIDTSDCSSWWTSDTFTVAVWSEGSTNYAQKVKWDTPTLCHFTFPDDAGNWFTLLRWNPAKINPDDYDTTKNSDIAEWNPDSDPNAKCWDRAAESADGNIELTNFNGIKKIYVKRDSITVGGKKYKQVVWADDTTDPPTGVAAGTTMSATIGNDVDSENSKLYNYTNEYNNEIKLYPVDATFYDYFTDYELDHGWKTSVTDSNISRTHENRVPYTRLNNYISSTYVKSPNGAWKYPLYFGDFNSHWSDNKENPNDAYYYFPYGSLNDKKIHDANGDPYPTNDTHLRNDGSNSTGENYLYNFSIYANNSGSIASRVGAYTGSTQGLVQSTLKGGSSNYRERKLALPTGEDSPYFSDDLLDPKHAYANKVTTQFPIRVSPVSESITDTENNTYNVNYTKYEFNSGGKDSSITSDNVYFTYNDDGTTNQLFYGQGFNYELLDAYKALGDNSSGDHRGFFPFDNKTPSDNVAKDYGFGMRLDLDFNLTEDGCIAGSKGKIPMKFEFEGDDDVWVFVDGNLLLDLGGDHGSAKGSISFKINDLKSEIETGTVQVQPNPSYGTTEYLSHKSSSHVADGEIVKKGFESSLLGTKINKQRETVYDVTKKHTLSFFYMERGLIESNLSLSFTMSPVENNITVDKTVVTTDVNPSLKSAVDDELKKKQTFNFVVTDNKNTAKYSYKDKDNSTAVTEEKVKALKFSLKDEEWRKFTNGFTAADPDTNVAASKVTVTEAVPSECKYKFDTVRSVVDWTNSTETNKSYLVAKGADLGTGTFDFKTNSTAANAPVDIEASFVNTVKLANVTLSKVFKEANGTDASDSASFTVMIKLPHESEPTQRAFKYKKGTDTNTIYDSDDGTVSLKNDESIVIYGLPVGSDVIIKETVDSTFESDPKNGEVTFTNIDSDKTAAFTNTKVVVGASLTPKVKKTIDGDDKESQTPAFSFKITEVDSQGATVSGGYSQEVTTNNSSTASFSTISFYNTTARYFKIEETGTYADYTTDTTVYYISVKPTLNKSQLVLHDTYKQVVNGNTSTFTPHDCTFTFNNTTVPKTGSIKVIKDSTDNTVTNFNGTKFAIVEADAAGTAPKSGAVPVEKEVTNGTYYVEFDNLTAGTTYLVYETKAPADHELDGTYHPVTVVGGDTVEITITNEKSTLLPQTGGIGVVVVIVIGAALVAFGIYLLKPAKKDKEASAEKSES